MRKWIYTGGIVAVLWYLFLGHVFCASGAIDVEGCFFGMVFINPWLIVPMFFGSFVDQFTGGIFEPYISDGLFFVTQFLVGMGFGWIFYKIYKKFTSTKV